MRSCAFYAFPLLFFAAAADCDSIDGCQPTVTAPLLQAGSALHRAPKIKILQDSTLTEAQVKTILEGYSTDVKPEDMANVYASNACIVVVGSPPDESLPKSVGQTSQVCGHDNLLNAFRQHKGDAETALDDIVVSGNRITFDECNAKAKVSDKVEITVNSELKISKVKQTNFGTC